MPLWGHCEFIFLNVENSIVALRESHVDLCAMRVETHFHIWCEVSSVSSLIYFKFLPLFSTRDLIHWFEHC